MSATDDLIKQILASSNTAKWTGEGKGSAQANAADMAKLLSDIGITDIKQFGKVPQYQQAETAMGFNGQPAYQSEDGYYIMVPGGTDSEGNQQMVSQAVDPSKLEKIYGYNDDNGFHAADQSKVTVKDGVPMVQTGTTFGNKLTGQTVSNTYGERQGGDFFGGTYEGKGNTGYGVQLDANGVPHFYTQGASSNDVANIMADLGPVGQIAAGVLGGPVAVAALAAASGKPIKDILKSAALSYLGGEAGNMVSGSTDLTNILGKGGTEALSGAAKQFVSSGGKTDPLQLLLGAGLNYGANTLGDQLGMGNLTEAQKKMLNTALSGAAGKQSLEQILMNVAMTGATAKDGKTSNFGPGTAKEFSEGLIPGYFLPGGEGYTGKEVTNPLGPTEEFDPSTIDWAAMYADTSNGSPAGADPSKYANQEMQIDPKNWQEYNDRLIDIVNNKGGYTSQWQTVGGDRIMVQDDGTAIATNENGDPYSLSEDEVNSMVKNGLLNTEASGYNDAIGKTKITTPTKTTTPTTQTPNPTELFKQTAQAPSQNLPADIKSMEELFGGNIDYRLRSLGSGNGQKTVSSDLDALTKLLRG
jgi:hypothetical protein